ncbi:cyclic peptide transporter [Teredinibacter turnerae T7901]|uniref:Cyclic peptide transporter n=1 Tax=Teredinibacter turnerae (strain ATCC 39867 / T7901) TaxID=377629 RepID=C5BN81_TERTT|nr:cyclic peptide export ABC transporter [Teredinibacter turnerae]ACR14066.1 cyclic peptide transporter [Teredinibacter turnerae T7901]
MKIFKTLTAEAPEKVFVSLLLGVFSGIGYAFLIPLILVSFNGDSAFEVIAPAEGGSSILEIKNAKFALAFFSSCLLIICSRTISQLILTRVAIDATVALRTKYYESILYAPLECLERVGESRLIASITNDIRSVIQGAQLMPDLLISLVTITGMMGFLAYLNIDIFRFICWAIFFGVISFQIPMILAGKLVKKSREKVDDLHESINGVIKGVKELKLSSDKRHYFFKSNLLESESQLKKSSKSALSVMRAAINYGDMMSFFVVGYIAFLFASFNLVSDGELFGAIMVLLYITGPISVIMNALPQIVTSNISLDKVEKIFGDMPKETVLQHNFSFSEFKSIHFKDVRYCYEDLSGGGAFEVGPLSFSIKAGEVIFIVGGNGSGKSTLAKMITAHYRPSAGVINVGLQAVDDKTIVGYRNNIAAIYTDYHLFENILGDTSESFDAFVRELLVRLKLGHAVSYQRGRFSTLKLSDGQRKRLALICALLENKQLYLFDEWAADQDPEFKQVFYHEILPHLRSQGKIVVVISHDERYFSSADRVIELEDGKISKVTVMSIDAPGRSRPNESVADANIL